MTDRIQQARPESQPAAMNAAQVQAMQKQFADDLRKIQHRMELRDRALDQACRVVTANNSTLGDPLKLANQMFAFLTADLPASVPDRQTPA